MSALDLHQTRDIDTPLGRYSLAATGAGLSHCLPEASPKLPLANPAAPRAAGVHLGRAAAALCAYFAGEKDPWEGLCLAPQGSDFQHEVWQALRQIPFGSTASYRDLGQSIGRAGAARAVGQANHRNPLAILVPCHRVIAADGGLGGYAGGTELKRWLLEHEGALPRALFSGA